jgi:hypothetical protein
MVLLDLSNLINIFIIILDFKEGIIIHYVISKENNSWRRGEKGERRGWRGEKKIKNNKNILLD